VSRVLLFPEAASTLASQTDHLLFFLLGVAGFFSALIAGLIVYFMIRYRRRPGVDHTGGHDPSLALEAAWIGIPLVIAMVIFFWGASLYASIYRPPDDALRVNVVGKQWMWKLQHMSGRREIDELHIPVGRPVELTLTSEDVIHSFYVPAFRVKQDAVPGRYTRIWFQATKVGEYHLFCAEYCGTLHSGMIGRIVAMDPAAFEAWLGAAAAGGGDVPVEVAGEAVFRAQACGTCHRADGTGRGPSLQGLFGRRVALTTGDAVVADEGYIRESIVAPQSKVVAGYQPVMPTYQGLVSEEDIMRLVAYVKSLRDGGGS
jgi:cytochrome c oxidase subunit II